MPIELVNNWDVETYRIKLEKANTDQTHESDTQVFDFFQIIWLLDSKILDTTYINSTKSTNVTTPVAYLAMATKHPNTLEQIGVEM